MVYNGSMSPEIHKKRLILLDAHAIIHRAYHALPDFSTSKGEPTGALYGISTMLIKIMEDLRPDYLVACYDLPGPTYRHEVYKEYKAGRKPLEDDLIAQLERSRDIFKALSIPIYDKTGFEADDVIGTIVQITNHQKPITKEGEKLEVIIASGDMDTMQLISGKDVKVFTLKKGIKDTVMYDEEGVRKRFGFGPELIPDYKGLRGDPSDNIIGVKGIGEKTATTLITTFGSIENMYEELKAKHDDAFLAAGITPRIIGLLRDNEEEAEFSKTLATINRKVPIDFVLPEKTIWESLDIAAAKKFWNELEFRTLGARLEQVIANKDRKKGAGSRPKVLSGSEGEKEETAITNNQETITKQTGKAKTAKRGTKNETTSVADGQSALWNDIPRDEFEKVAVALWLINSTITNPQLEDILEFAGTRDFTEASKAIFAELDKQGLRKVYDTIELPLIPVIHAMEKRGIKTDRAMLAKLSKTYHADLDRLGKEIWKLAGVEFNINSPKQLGDILFDRLQLKAKNLKKTSGGARSTRESELEKLREAHPIVPLIFQYRELQKLLSTYIDAIPPLLDQNDRLHSHFVSAGSTTGRMASLDPNLQNIPVKTELGKAIRHAFIAEKGYKLCAFDYSQMELRIAAFLSGDEKLIDIFRKGEDVHASVASHVFGVAQSDVTPEMRRRAKVINFGIIYGMGVLALKQNLGTSRDEAQKFYNDYFATFSTLAHYLDKVKEETAERGFTETYFGRRRSFEGINSRISHIKAQAERMAINAPIQGTEADIIKLALIRIDEYIKREKLGDKVFPLLQVHDELVYEIDEKIADKVAPEIEKIMESIIDPSETRGVVMKAKASIGDNWGDLK